ncbi:MAG: hypothetical protein LBI48_00680 [Burkholderiaceae bacterium]|jgi:hypothetical protein|nr:hypothetical protein [Burkholderiaceae bacterium]
MAAKSTTLSTSVLNLLLNGVAIPALAGNAAASPAAQLYVALHTADPGAGGNQTGSEVGYTGYARVPVVRDGTGWSVADGVATLVNDAPFAKCADAINVTATHCSFGLAAAGAGTLLYRAALTPVLPIQNGTAPVLEKGTTISES